MSSILPISDALLPKWLSPRLNPDEALDPINALYDELYEPLYKDDPDDPIRMVLTDIELKVVQSLNFISGFRGSGKTTELFRLRKQLQDDGYFVAYANALDYLLPTEPVDISDFHIILAGSFSDSLEKQLHFDPVKEGWWTRIVHYLAKTNVELEGFDVKAGAKAHILEAGLNFKAALRTESSFRQRLREKMLPRLGELKEEVQKFFAAAIKKVKQKTRIAKNVVFIFDQLEQLRDTVGDQAPVAESMTTLIDNHQPDLQVPFVHCVYTIPPWIKFKLKNFLPGLFYNVKLWNNNPTRTTNPAGLKTMRSIVQRRFTVDGIGRYFGDQKSDGSSPLVDRLIQASGGHFRDLIRLLRGTLLRAHKLPIETRIVDSAIVNLRSSFLPIPIQDAVWLHEIGQTRDCLMKDSSPESIRQMTSFLDSHCVMIHCNGDEWYDVHPIIRAEIAEIVKRNKSRPKRRDKK